MKKLSLFCLAIVLMQQSYTMDSTATLVFNANLIRKEKIERLRQLPFEKLIALRPENADDQLILGNYLLQLLTGNSYYQETHQEYNIEIFDLAEKWLLEAKNKGNAQAFYDCVRLYIIKEDFIKAIQIAQDGIRQKIYDLYVLLIDIYKKTAQNENAFLVCNEAISIFNTQSQYIQYRNRVNNELAYFYENGIGCKKNIKKAIELYRLSASNGSVTGKFMLVSMYIQGNECIKKDLKAAKKLLQSIAESAYSSDEITYYVLGVASLGGMYELEGNIKQAEAAYKLIEHQSGKYYLANLVLKDRLKGSKEQAKEILKKGAKEDIFAAYIWGTLLVLEGNPEEAIEYFEKPSILAGNDFFVNLQLAIAYTYGFGVIPNLEKAKQYINLISQSQFKTQSNLLCMGYIKLIGLDGKIDIPQAIKLIDESKKAVQDVLYEIDMLFPNMKSLLAQHREAVANELLAEPNHQKISKKKQSKIKKQPDVKLNPFTTIEFWNSDEFTVKDNCRVIDINIEDRIITIDSPDTNEIFEIEMNCFKDDARWVKTLIYHPRIQERQGIGNSVDAKTKYDHTFPEILDYIIQVGGIEVPFVKHGVMNEQLVAPVKRIDKATGKCTKCRLEYTFGEDKFGTKYVYHRLARPQ